MNIIVIGLVIFIKLVDIKEGNILLLEFTIEKNVIKAIVDIDIIIDSPNGWFGVRAVKYANITNIPPM